MSEPRPVLVSLGSHCEAFQQYLKQIERRNWEHKIFYLPADIRTWMNTDSSNGPHSNVVGLIADIYGDGIATISATQCADYLLVLATLLHPDVDCGNLIDVFTKCRLSDHMLRQDTASSYRSILDYLERDRPSLPRKYKQDDYAAVTDAFDKARWAFCPVSLRLHMDEDLPLGPCILPFFFREDINSKGGTAHVHRYKIQESLVESSELKKALAFSRHEDLEFGWCYEFAVKSYATGWEDIYKFESKAFRAVREIGGVVKYLGEYHFREESNVLPNHNIILEYGQSDLDEYLAETYPPVMTAETIAFWEGFFKLADTLRQLHQLEYVGEDGRTQHFRGWHGDIKPDNILRVHEAFKLADFGFAKFEKKEIGKNSTFMLGGTRTYGAPECDQQRLGTSTPHLQTIDTWSFGCVLSAVATWVILGSQAYDNYRQVRMMEITELRKRVKENKCGTAPSGDDAFHDGTKILSSVRHWHDLLRNSSRKADTISSRVLDLVEKEMLLERPTDRLSFDQLCDKLEEILILARNEHVKRLEDRTLKELEPDTLEALLRLDKRAPAKATAIVQMNTAQSVRAKPIHERGSNSLLPESHSQPRPTSDRVRKSERLDQIVIGKTANRQVAIESYLGRNSVGFAGSTELFESPLQSPVDTGEHSIGRQKISISKGKGVDIPEFRLTEASPEAGPTGGLAPSATGSGTPSERYIGQPAKPSMPLRNASGVNPVTPSELITTPVSKVSGTGHHAGHSGTIKKDEERDLNRSQHGTNTPATPPQVHRQAATLTIARQIPSIQGGVEQQTSNPVPEMPPSPPTSPDANAGRDAVEASSNHGFTPSELVRTSYEPAAIFREHTRLKKLWESGSKRGAFASFFGGGPREDPWLKEFIFNRDIVFVVDNAISMKAYWEEVEMVLQTLAMKIGPLDKDGLDLLYTIGTSHNVREVKGWDIPKKFERSMEAVGENINDQYRTDMRGTLQRIFDRYTDVSKRMTLIILTDGLWEGGAPTGDVEELIVNFISDVARRLKKWESRWFSIQFVSFGDNVVALKRLQDLDDHLPTKEDVIDTKPWWFPNVDKLILGSMTYLGDNDNADSPSLLRSHSSTPSRRLSSASNSSTPGVERNHSTRTSSTKRGLFSKYLSGNKH